MNVSIEPRKNCRFITLTVLLASKLPERTVSRLCKPSGSKMSRPDVYMLRNEKLEPRVAHAVRPMLMDPRQQLLTHGKTYISNRPVRTLHV